VEDIFEDSEGTNATGTYSVRIKLNNDIPNFLPMNGRYVKIYYRRIKKLCTSCFGRHVSRYCKTVSGSLFVRTKLSGKATWKLDQDLGENEAERTNQQITLSTPNRLINLWIIK
jgi:hypothetical protein